MGFSLGSLAGGVAQGFQNEQQIAMQRALQQQQAAGDAALGNTLMGTVGQPQGNPLQSFLGKLGLGGAPAPQPAAPSPPGPQGPTMPSQGLGGLPMPPAAPSPSAAPARPVQPGAAPPGAPPQPAQGGAPQGGFDLAAMAQRIKQHNPGITPQGVVAALRQYVPMMNAQSQQQYRQIQEMLGAGRLSVQEGGLDERKRHDQEIEDLAKGKADFAREKFDFAKEQVAARVAKHDQDVAMKQKQFEEARSDRQRNAAEGELMRAIAARRAASQEAINAANVPDEDKQRLRAQAEADAKTAQDALDAARERVKGLTETPKPAETTTVKPNADGSKITKQPAVHAKDDAAPVMTPEQKMTALGQAREAISQGAPRDAVIKKMQELGLDPSGL